MAKQTVNLGSSANDGTGDPLRTAFDKINDNFARRSISFNASFTPKDKIQDKVILRGS